MKQFIKAALSTGLILLSLNSFAGAPEQDARVHQLRDMFANGKSIQSLGTLGESEWHCQHFNAFLNDFWIERVVTMDFYSAGPYAYNSGNFVVKFLKNTPQGLIGKVSIPNYNGAELYSVLRMTEDGEHLVGEVSVEPQTLGILGRYYKHGQAFSGPASVVDSSKTVFYYTYCRRSK